VFRRNYFQIIVKMAKEIGMAKDYLGGGLQNKLAWD
jgi:hypothetical protein